MYKRSGKTQKWTMSSESETSSIVNICNALAYALMKLCIPTPSKDPTATPGLESLTLKKGKDKAQKNKTNKATVHEYVLEVTGGGNQRDIVPILFRMLILQTWVAAKQLTQQQISKNLGEEEKAKRLLLLKFPESEDQLRQEYMQLNGSRTTSGFFADRQPDREELHLPACLTKDMLFKSYEDEMKQGKIRPVSRSRFHEIWLQQMPNVKIRKDPDDLPQCQTCATIQTGLMQLPCKQDREKFLNLRSTDLELQARCRKKYYKHIRKAAKDGLEGRHLSLIIDGMDQAKTRLRRFSVYSKADAHLHKMQQHVTGIKVHNTNQTYLMTWTDTLHPDANVTINALVHVLHDISKV
ncbi:hypothetical protein MAR_031327 [Mya arenaria]|uniref:DUF7869 domain-containing protein n=1 Tax=Mya arenaria TaxID=6604 RepID=A0ABY7F7R9_MYAAR|nr:hypothetical protein MAR_031327 [Mya arenaria]